MNKFGVFMAAAKPIAKKVVPVLAAAGFAAFQAISEQKAAAHVDDLGKRVKDIEQLFKK